MKKLLLLTILLIPIFCFGQKQKYVDAYTKVMDNLNDADSKTFQENKDTIKNWLDNEYFKIDGDNIVVSKVINDVQGTKDDIYIKVKNFFTRYYNDANSVIQTDDKESGTIIAKAFCKDFQTYFGSWSSDNLSKSKEYKEIYSCYYILRIDIKDNRIRIFCSANEMKTIKNYYLDDQIFSNSYKIVNTATLDKYKMIVGVANIEAVIKLVKIMHATIDTVEKTIKEGAIKGENDDW